MPASAPAIGFHSGRALTTQRAPGLNPFSAAYRPQESLSTQIVTAMVRQARNATSPVTGRKLDLTMLTGDNADSQQFNETRWFIDMLDGTTGSGDPDPEMDPARGDHKINPDSGVPSEVSGCNLPPGFSYSDNGSPYDGVRGGGRQGQDTGYYEPDGSSGAKDASAGSFVAILPLKQMPPMQRRAAALSAAEEKKIRGALSTAAAMNGVEPIRAAPVAFRIGEPALDLFPTRLWARLQSRRAISARASTLGYGDGAGHPGLRSAIASYVSSARSVVAHPDHVIITRGTHPGRQRAVGSTPLPPSAARFTFAAKIAWYSAVNGASWPAPGGLVGSQDNS